MNTAVETPPQTTATLWDGSALLGAFTSAANLLIANQHLLNALNVYPYPDGDTGANMALTMRAAIDEAGKLAPEARANAGHVASRIDAGALLGARGNSGVILSQMLRGFARSLAGRSQIDGSDFVRALAGGRDAAYRAVLEPVEGTMLTVLRVAADHAAANATSIATATAAALRGAEIALAETPRQLAKLREAGVVDAGGQGIVYLLDGLDRFARGEQVPEADPGETHDIAGSMAFLDRIDDIHGADESGYCTNFMIFGHGIPFEHVRETFSAMGHSAVIVGDEAMVRVHIHTDDPGSLLSRAIHLGELGQIKIDNMSSQLESLIERRTAAATFVLPPHDSATCPRIGVVAVAAGPGLAAALKSLGACAVVDGGQSMNPSVEQLHAAIDLAPAEEAILLPNNQNILLSANRVAEISRKRVAVVPSTSIPQALAALEAFNEDEELDALVAAMTTALRTVRTVEIARAQKDAAAGGIAVVKGQWLGLLDHRLVATGEDPVAVALETVKLAGGEEAELITAFVGEAGPPAESDLIFSLLQSTFRDAEIQVYEGGQPLHRYVIAVE